MGDPCLPTLFRSAAAQRKQRNPAAQRARKSPNGALQRLPTSANSAGDELIIGAWIRRKSVQRLSRRRQKCSPRTQFLRRNSACYVAWSAGLAASQHDPASGIPSAGEASIWVGGHKPRRRPVASCRGASHLNGEYRARVPSRPASPMRLSRDASATAEQNRLGSRPGSDVRNTPRLAEKTVSAWSWSAQSPRTNPPGPAVQRTEFQPLPWPQPRR